MTNASRSLPTKFSVVAGSFSTSGKASKQAAVELALEGGPETGYARRPNGKRGKGKGNVEEGLGGGLFGMVLQGFEGLRVGWKRKDGRD